MRLSDATVQFGNFLGTAGVDDLGRIEILRGPQAAFYGGEAIGGVVWLETARGSDSPAGRLDPRNRFPRQLPRLGQPPRHGRKPLLVCRRQPPDHRQRRALQPLRPDPRRTAHRVVVRRLGRRR